VGQLGGAGRPDGNIAGETPNLASRLQACAGPGQLVISEATRNLIGEAFEIEDLAARALKGFGGEARLFRVVRARPVESRFGAAHSASLTPFIGRRPELNLLLERWALAKAGEGQAVLISG
jgi:class 3 adenylate cyclase